MQERLRVKRTRTSQVVTHQRQWQIMMGYLWQKRHSKPRWFRSNTDNVHVLAFRQILSRHDLIIKMGQLSWRFLMTWLKVLLKSNDIETKGYWHECMQNNMTKLWTCSLVLDRWVVPSGRSQKVRLWPLSTLLTMLERHPDPLHDSWRCPRDHPLQICDLWQSGVRPTFWCQTRHFKYVKMIMNWESQKGRRGTPAMAPPNMFLSRESTILGQSGSQQPTWASDRHLELRSEGARATGCRKWWWGMACFPMKWGHRATLRNQGVSKLLLRDSPNPAEPGDSQWGQSQATPST